MASSQTISEQNDLLRRSASRKILRRVRHDAISMAQQLVGRESEPSATCTGTGAHNTLALGGTVIGTDSETRHFTNPFGATSPISPTTGPRAAILEGCTERYRPVPETSPYSGLPSPTFSPSDRTSAGSVFYSTTPTSPSLVSSNTSLSAGSQAGSRSSFLRRLSRLGLPNFSTSRSPRDETSMSSMSRLRIRFPGEYAATDIYLQSGAGGPPSGAVAAAQRGDRDMLWLIRHREDIHTPDGKTGRTPLAVACHCGYDDIVKILIDVGANVNVCDNDQLTPLHLAAANGHCGIAEMLIDHMADVNACDSTKRTPLRIACDHGQLAVIRILLRHFGTIDSRDEEERTALHAASETGDYEVVRLLLHFGANKDAKDAQIRAPLHIACAAGWVRVVQELLDARVDIEALEEERLTPLATAARSGYAAVVDLLLRHKASPKAESVGGFTPLHWASYNGHEDAAGIIIANKKTNLNSRDKHDRTPLHIAAMSRRFSVIEKLTEAGANIEAECQKRNRPLHFACKYATHREVSLLLVAGADFNARTETGETPLHVAVREGSVEMAKSLLRCAVWVDAVDTKGVRPLAIACLAGHHAITHQLLRHGAALHIRSIETGRGLDAPMCLAASGGHVQVLQLLFKYNADVREADSGGWEPLRHAAFMGHAEAVVYLLENGARATDLGELAEFSFSSAVSPEMRMRITALLAADMDLEHRPPLRDGTHRHNAQRSISSEPIELT